MTRAEDISSRCRVRALLSTSTFTMTCGAGSAQCQAPEVLLKKDEDNLLLTFKVDMFSFVVSLECFEC